MSIPNVTSLEGMKGLQIGTPQGTNAINNCKALGASPVAVPTTDMFSALEKGIIVGRIGPVQMLRSQNFAEVTKNTTFIGVGGTPFIAYMNMDTWNKLPADIQQIIDSYKQWTIDEGWRLYDEVADQDCVEYARKLGHNFNYLSDAELEKFYNQLLPVAQGWAATQDTKGLPGTDVLNTALGLLKENEAKYGKAGPLK
jgi:TRAP-type C4-dicarboxylate transport system substrate-binding protein